MYFIIGYIDHSDAAGVGFTSSDNTSAYPIVKLIDRRFPRVPTAILL